jgi:hypothetical protein
MSKWTLPARLYVDAAVFEKELSSVFRRSWILFGPSQGRLEGPGTAWAQTLVPHKPLVAVGQGTGASQSSVHPTFGQGPNSHRPESVPQRGEATSFDNTLLILNSTL